MSPRPIHRWKSFWLGLLMLIFLGWAWARSVHSVELLEYEFTGSSYQPRIALGHGEGALGILWDHHAGGNGLILRSLKIRDPGPWFPFPVKVHRLSIGVAHWFLILLFLIPWTGFLLWRVRRMRRAGEMPRSVESS